MRVRDGARKWTVPGLLVLALLLPPGCATPGRNEQIDVVAGSEGPARFRGRWWSYYARARSAQQRGDFAAAEGDLLIALKSRSADQLWPRTYGMHFIREYFPHRELGVNYFLQGRLDDAIAELETSLAQQYSARAAYYFAEAQTRLIASTGRDTEAPVIEVTTKTAALNATEILLAGVARDDTFVASITVNGAPFDVRLSDPEVPFAMPVTLRPGANTVEVAVRDLAGRETVEHILLENDLDGPSVSFDTPPPQPGLLTGVVLDPSGVESLAIGGQPATLLDMGDGLFSFSANLPGSDGATPLVFACYDTLGNRTDGIVPGTGLGDAPQQALRIASNDAELPAALLRADRFDLAAVEGSTLRVSFENVEDGKRYYQDEIALNLKVDSAGTPVEKLALSSDPDAVLGGDPVNLIRDRDSQFVTRRVSFNQKKGDITLRASVADQSGATAEDSKTVTREVNALEVVENLLGVTFVLDGNNPDSQKATNDTPDEKKLANTLVDKLMGNHALDARFILLGREEMPELLRELEYSELLAESERALNQGLFIPFEVLFSVGVNLDQGNLEIIVEGSGTETGARVLFPRIEVSGPEAKAEELVENLVLRLLQEFPRVPGEVLAWSAPSLKCSLGADQGAFKHRKCLVFKLDGDGPPEEQFPFILGEGLIDGVATRYTSIKLLKSAGDQPVTELPIEKGHYVVLK